MEGNCKSSDLTGNRTRNLPAWGQCVSRLRVIAIKCNLLQTFLLDSHRVSWRWWHVTPWQLMCMLQHSWWVLLNSTSGVMWGQRSTADDPIGLLPSPAVHCRHDRMIHRECCACWNDEFWRLLSTTVMSYQMSTEHGCRVASEVFFLNSFISNQNYSDSIS
jgi:hypothetical protein